eukprot:CAMPEP_0172302290 /NCGR_PEP_ID=MMETSP1058-20130122/4022_1 /TAXON_ID=83371 /ORGANISM="Detonula confervacea, Strain CCMP 353" /LENGTH=145 /DNA_ID=CAMNT_0013012715 /DNA_START=376 /DNA_END=810 /DNA_ORIENTATION=-
MIMAFHFPAMKFKHSTRIRNNSGNTMRYTPSSYTTTNLSMGLYEDEIIDWDDDLFGQIGKSDNKQLESGGDSRKEVSKKGSKSDDDLDDDIWDMGEQSKSTNNVKSMREQMKQSWGAVDKDSEEGKPTADWMPRFRNGPEEDEPW